MKRAILRGPSQLEFEDIDLNADDLSEDQIYAETEFSAVSVGTESAAYLGQPPLRPGSPYPRFVGYCNAGKVMRVGREVRGFKVGDRILTHQSHQSAFACRSEDILARVPEFVSTKVASLTYLAHIGLAALQKADLRPGESVAVLGLGAIGLATVNVAAALGAHVVALGNDDYRLKKAAELGARASLRSDDPNLKQQIEAATAGVGIDLLVTTANSWESWRTALDIPRQQGRIAVLGFPGRSEGPPSFNPFDPFRFHSKQLTVYAAGSVPESHVAPNEIRFTLQRNMKMLLRLVGETRLSLDRLITHCVPWHELRQIYELAGRKDKTMIAAVLDWGK